MGYAVKEKERKRYDALRAELGLPPVMEKISLFVEGNTEAEIFDEEREIR